MADYKEIITGAAGKLAEKVKEIPVDKLTDKVKEIPVGKIVDKVMEVPGVSTVRDVYDKGTTRAKAYGKIARLTLELNSTTEELKKVYTEIGKLYYEQNAENPEGYFAPLFARVGEITAELTEKEEAIEYLKEEVAETINDIEVEIQQDADDFDSVVSADEQEKG